MPVIHFLSQLVIFGSVGLLFSTAFTEPTVIFFELLLVFDVICIATPHRALWMTEVGFTHDSS